MRQYNLSDAKAKLSEVIKHVLAGEEVTITKMGKPIAKITRLTAEPKAPIKLGQTKGFFTYVAPDFDAPLEDFAEYM
jgi:prevent-host-death family protein